MTQSFRPNVMLLAAAVAISLTTLAPRPAAAGLHYSALYDTDSFTRATKTKTFAHKIAGLGTKLTIKLTMQEGAAEARLVDSNGKVRWSRNFTPGKATLEEHFDGAAGTWTIQLDLKKATGRYSVSLVDD